MIKGLSKSMTSRTNPDGFIALMNIRIALIPELKLATPTAAQLRWQEA